jgi:altronate hydrolase
MGSQLLHDVVISLHAGDSVGIARAPIPAGTMLLDDDRAIRVPADVPAGHKVALTDVAVGVAVRLAERVLGEHRLVGPVERADAEVHDADPEPRRVERGPPDV